MILYKKVYGEFSLYNKSGEGTPVEMEFIRMKRIGRYLKRSGEYFETLPNGHVYQHLPSMLTNTKGACHYVREYKERFSQISE